MLFRSGAVWEFCWCRLEGRLTLFPSGFQPSKRQAALIAPCDQGIIVLALYLGITRTEAFLMVSSTSYLDVRSMSFSRFIMLLLLIVYEYHVIFTRSCLNLKLALVA